MNSTYHTKALWAVKKAASKNVQDKAKAIYNVKKVLELKDIEKLTLKDLTNPYKYIEEYITMRVISKEVYDIISYDS